MREGFAAFILTHGRADRVLTYRCLRNYGYTGPIYLVVDDCDPQQDAYKEKYGDEVIIFDKAASAALSDLADNKPHVAENMRSIVFARNTCWGIARDLGVKSFIQLDDDYPHFCYRFDSTYTYNFRMARNLDTIFEAYVEFMEATPRVALIAMAQGGDFIGGSAGTLASHVRLTRKCMNTFVCLTDRPLMFPGRINEDVNAYTGLGARGVLFLTNNQTSVNQIPTQKQGGGMTDIYLDVGTYVKSFYSVIFQPSSVTVRDMGDGSARRRLHHSVSWPHTTPKIVRETLRKD